MNEFRLDKHPKIKPGFKIPDGYFDSLSVKVMGQISEPEVKVISISNRKSWLFAAAAVLVLSFAIPTINKLTVAKNQPDQAALENYLAYHTDITDDELVDLLENEDIEKIKIDYQLEDKEIEDALSSGSNIENYILN
jgi:hypothetical protein